MRTCKQCGETKPLSEFRPNGRPKLDGSRHLKTKCIRCVNIEGAAKRKKWRSELSYEERSALDRKEGLQKNYGITIEQYNTMLQAQDGVCAICKKVCISGKNLSVDHDHDTGEVRGLLCGKCNKGIGLFNDNPSLLREAALYLESTTYRIERAA